MKESRMDRQQSTSWPTSSKAVLDADVLNARGKQRDLPA